MTGFGADWKFGGGKVGGMSEVGGRMDYGCWVGEGVGGWWMGWWRGKMEMEMEMGGT